MIELTNRGKYIKTRILGTLKFISPLMYMRIQQDNSHHLSIPKTSFSLRLFYQQMRLPLQQVPVPLEPNKNKRTADQQSRSHRRKQYIINQKKDI